MGDIVKDAIEEAFRRFPDKIENGVIVQNNGNIRYTFIEGARFAAGASAGAEMTTAIVQAWHYFMSPDSYSEAERSYVVRCLDTIVGPLHARAAARADEHSDEKSAEVT